jgi:predicted AlkP superfamily pyrophosphatase or phosphodiesterase
MVDACGWEIIKNDPFGRSFAPERKRISSVFGYSSACVPSILSGAWPAEHRNWCYFVHDPKNSPFRFLRPLRWLPAALTSRRIVRRALTKLVKRRLNFRGYFDLYNIPFKHIALYDFTETKSPLKPRGMNRGKNIFDFLEERAIGYYVSDPDQTEEGNLAELVENIKKEKVDFAFMYWPGLDGLLHRVGTRSPEIPAKLRAYEKWIENLLAITRSHYEEIHLYVFSDHGMADCEELLDLRAKIGPLKAKMGKDYAVVYDSTMARFWFFNDRARQEIISRLKTVPEGRILSDDELKQLNTFFPDRYFGELIFLVREGVLIVPSHMGERPLAAMHGYHPEEKHSYAVLMTNQTSIPEEVRALPDFFRLMTHEAELAKSANRKSKPLISPLDPNSASKL